MTEWSKKELTEQDLEALDQAAQNWCAINWHASQRPNEIAIYASNEPISWQQLARNIDQLAVILTRSGLTKDDGLAILLTNQIEFVITLMAGLKTGLRVTPVNWHLDPKESAYIVSNCEAKAIITDTKLEDRARECGLYSGLSLKLSINGALPGFENFWTKIENVKTEALDPTPGKVMLYTSGTTGRPKGVLKKNPDVILPSPLITKSGYKTGDIHLCCGPAYHAAPLVFDILFPLSCGIPVVLHERFEATQVLEAITKHGITHAHLVPTMFKRMLDLPQDIKDNANIDSLRIINHGAAPCPPEIKHRMIDWFGPVLLEYYAGSEGGVGIEITSQEWLKKPGSVGKLPVEGIIRILDESNTEVSRGVEGRIFMAVSDQNPFTYFKAPEKTEQSHFEGFFSLGDVGFIDEDGYLFLSGRTAECIISGGINIYPQEIDDALIGHPAIQDVCTVGAPDEAMGETVRTAVKLAEGFVANEALEKELLAFAAQNLSKFKCPKGIDFVDDLPRLPSGKVVRSKVRQSYWKGLDRAI